MGQYGVTAYELIQQSELENVDGGCAAFIAEVTLLDKHGPSFAVKFPYLYERVAALAMHFAEHDSDEFYDSIDFELDREEFAVGIEYCRNRINEGAQLYRDLTNFSIAHDFVRILYLDSDFDRGC